MNLVSQISYTDLLRCFSSLVQFLILRCSLFQFMILQLNESFHFYSFKLSSSFSLFCLSQFVFLFNCFQFLNSFLSNFTIFIVSLKEKNSIMSMFKFDFTLNLFQFSDFDNCECVNRPVYMFFIIKKIIFDFFVYKKEENLTIVYDGCYLLSGFLLVEPFYVLAIYISCSFTFPHF